MPPGMEARVQILYPINLKSAHTFNPYTLQLLQSVQAEAHGIEVASGLSSFLRRKRYDVVHIQWPESLFGWKDHGRRGIERVRLYLQWHRLSSRIVTTVHNYSPQNHLASGEEMYEIVYSATDDFVHLGNSSRDAFLEANGDKPWAKMAAHHVIPHGEYAYYRDLPRDETLADSVRKQKKGPSFLVFGALRDLNEEALARQAFLEANIPDATLIFAGALAPGMEIDVEPHASIQRFHSRIDPNQIIPLLEVSDAIFIPRRGRLNSGVVSLALTFGVPVIGPKEGVIDEQLSEIGGFLYEPGSVHAAAESMRAVAALAEPELEAVKQRIDEFRRKHMLWPDVAKQHLAIYQRPLSERKVS
jgi:hypothetical protein